MLYEKQFAWKQQEWFYFVFILLTCLGNADLLISKVHCNAKNFFLLIFCGSVDILNF